MNLANPAKKNSLSYRFRARRNVFLKDFLLQAKPAGDAPCRILDLGGDIGYWQRLGLDWLRQNSFTVQCVNLHLDDSATDAVLDGPIRLVKGNACCMEDLANYSFDIVHSNSVIEHVGQWQDMKDFAREVRRLAPAYYVQTPYFWFPVDPHFSRAPMIHWLPESLRASVHLRWKAGWGEKVRDLDEAMAFVHSSLMLDRRQFKWLFSDAEHRFERVAGLPKSMIATRLPSSIIKQSKTI